MREKGPARLILARHLDTRSRQVRDDVRDDPANQRLLTYLVMDPPPIDDITCEGKTLFERYPLLPEDRSLPILEDQKELGRRIGQAIYEKYGVPRKWNESPLLRTIQTSKLLLDGMKASGAKLPKRKRNRLLREKGFGKAERYPSLKVYVAVHPEELLKYLEDPKKYTPPAGESERQFKRRIGLLVWGLTRLPGYANKTTILVSHSKTIEEIVNQLTGLSVDNNEIGTGSITVLEAEPTKLFRKRRYRLVGEVGQQLVKGIESNDTSEGV